ncbi:MAG: SseB family protein [Acidobacteria bacterium]|nr:SseB family protein [Acidobacteriota bacterium]
MSENSRALPGHIAAALASAGGSADTAGQPWAGRNLAGESAYHNFEQDDGLASPAYTAAIASLRQGIGSEAAVVESLATARIFIPIVATAAQVESTAEGHYADKESDMSLVTLTGPDGRRALPVFTSTAALERWHSTARPVAAYAARAALSAVAEEASMLVVDPGADFTFVVRRPAVWALAQQRPWLPSYQDPRVAAVVEATAAPAVAVVAVRLDAGSGVAARDAAGATVPGGGVGPELRLTLSLQSGLTEAQVNALVGELQSRLSANELFAEAVDSLEIRLQSAAHQQDPS